MKAKRSDQQREEQAKRKRQNHQCEYMGLSERVSLW